MFSQEKEHCGRTKIDHGCPCGKEFTLVSLYFTEITRYRSWFLKYKLPRVKSVPQGHPWWILYEHHTGLQCFRRRILTTHWYAYVIYIHPIIDRLQFTYRCLFVITWVVPKRINSMIIHHAMLIAVLIVRLTWSPVVKRHRMSRGGPSPLTLNCKVIPSQPEPRPCQIIDAKDVWNL